MRARLLSTGVAAILIGSPAAMASYSFTTLTDPNASGFTMASGINDAGEVVGSYKDGNNTHGFSYVSGAFTTLDVTFNDKLAISTSANGVNNLGQIIGSFKDATGSHGFVLSVNVYTKFDDPNGVGTTSGSGINLSGQLVGNFFDSTQVSRGFRASGGIPPTGFTAVNALAGVGTNVGINIDGTVVGSYVTVSGTHGFVTMGATTTTLDDPLALGVTAAAGINDAGDIVGYFVDVNNITHGFVDVGGNFTTIDDPNAVGLTQVFGINDLGELVGMYVDASGEVHGFVATASVPEPGTLALLGMSLAGTMMLRRRCAAARRTAPSPAQRR